MNKTFFLIPGGIILHAKNLLIFIGFLFLLSASGCKKDENAEPKVLKDADGNMYNTVKIGTQEWMVENLRTTKYNDGQSIPYVTGASEWAALATPGYCWFNNETANKDPYGALYNWHAVATNKLCPKGWRVPTNDEWEALVDFTGGSSVSGGVLKEQGLNHWFAPNLDATDGVGFKALGGGYRDVNGPFKNLKADGYWWTSTEYSTTGAFSRYIYYYNAIVWRIFDDKKGGASVRCIKD